MRPATAPSGATSRTLTFNDPDSYGQTVRSTRAEIVVTGRGNFNATLTKIDFQSLWIQRGQDSLPRIICHKVDPSRSPIYFLSSFNQANTNESGTELVPGDIVFLSPEVTHHSHTTGASAWGAMSLTPDDLASVSCALVGRELAAPSVTHQLHPDSRSMARLMRLHMEAGQLAKVAPDILANPQVARSLEQKLIHAMVRCLASGMPAEASASHRRHTAILSRLEALLWANSDQPLHLAEICLAVGASERTLRLCTQEHLGMGPIQYLWLRRMHLAHRALLRGSPETTSVTEIATGHGFWELGRFAVAHRTLFGESPSATLGRPPVDSATRDHRPFALATPQKRELPK